MNAAALISPKAVWMPVAKVSHLGRYCQLVHLLNAVLHGLPSLHGALTGTRRSSSSVKSSAQWADQTVQATSAPEADFCKLSESVRTALLATSMCGFRLTGVHCFAGTPSSKARNLWFDDPYDSDPLRVIEQRKNALRSRKLQFQVGAVDDHKNLSTFIGKLKD